MKTTVKFSVKQCDAKHKNAKMLTSLHIFNRQQCIKTTQRYPK